MNIISVLPLLLAASNTAAPLDMQHWQQCRLEPSPLVRLACYDSLGNGLVQTSEGEGSKSPVWQAIWDQEQTRTPDSAPFLLQQDADHGRVIITRPALRGATLAIGCVDSITHIRLRLDAPWSGAMVQIGLDGQSNTSPQNWFIRDQGLLLEYGRGLPAIEELKRWIGHRELLIRSDNDVLLRFDLSGLKQALVPVRQLCRW